MVVLIALIICSIVSLGIILERLVFFVKNKDFSIETADQNLNILATLISIAPLLGILGTILGIMQSFGGFEGIAPDTKIIGAGISIALSTTAYGLGIAIVDLIFYNYFQHKIDIKEKNEKK
jgi:biopolymer transport protein ExbB/TolQ